MCCEKSPEACSTAGRGRCAGSVLPGKRGRACSIIQLQRSTYRYCSVADEQAALRVRLRDLAQARVSYGYRRIHILLQREGWKVNHKRVYRLYRLEGLGMRPKKPRRHVTACRRIERPVATEINESWSMDFMSDQLYDGRWIRLLTLVDNFNRESLAIEVGEHIGSDRVVEILAQLSKQRDLPGRIQVDKVRNSYRRGWISGHISMV